MDEQVSPVRLSHGRPKEESLQETLQPANKPRQTLLWLYQAGGWRVMGPGWQAGPLRTVHPVNEPHGLGPLLLAEVPQPPHLVSQAVDHEACQVPQVQALYPREAANGCSRGADGL